MMILNTTATIVPVPTHYRVRDWAPGGATVRTSANQRSDIIARLRCGADWYGDPVVGKAQTVTGFGRSDIWVEDKRGLFVWSGLLEKVRA